MTVTIARPKSPLDAFVDPEIRVEGREKVSGRAQYTSDINKPNQLWAAFANSAVPHARILSIDTSEAKQVPGVRAILTGADIGPKRFGRNVMDWPVLSFEKVRFIGEHVAAVAAETQDAAVEAASRIYVEYDELPAVYDAREALRPHAPVLHEHADEYIAGERPPRNHPNLMGWIEHRKGESDLEPLFAKAYRVFEHEFTTPRHHHGFIEPHSCLVWIDDAGVLHVHTPCKAPFRLRRQLEIVTGLARDKIVIETSYIGGDFGGKGLVIDEFACYFLAKATGRPVKSVMTYSDELQGTNVRHPAQIRLRTGVDKDGKFLVHDGEVVYNGGAYGGTKPSPALLPGQMGFATIGYQVPNVRLHVDVAYTNTLPSGHVRAPADVQTIFAWEVHVDMMARELGIDPLELRLRNVMRPGDRALTNEAIREPIGREVLEAIKRESDWGKPLPPGRGRGIAFACRHTGHGKTSLKMSLQPDGEVAVLYGTPDQGSGSATVIRRVVSAELSIEPERVTIRRGNTDEALVDPGAGASRVTHVAGGAALDAARKLRERLEGETKMTLFEDHFVAADGTREPFETVVRRLCAGGPIEVVGEFDGEHHTDEHPADYSFSAFCIEASVDKETGAVEVHDVVLAVDVGAVINPVAHRGQVDGGFIYGLGGALFEELIVDEGKVVNPNLGEYKLPTQMDVPPLRTIHVRGADGNGPFGAKMAGELSNSAVAPAIANAIYDAAGVWLTDFPLTAERVYEAMNPSKRASASSRRPASTP